MPSSRNEPRIPLDAGHKAAKLPKGRDPRDSYRVERSFGTPLEAKLTIPDGRVFTGDCCDLSIAGAGVALARTKDPEMREGAQVKVKIQHLSRPSGIEADAEVVSVALVGGSVRYGLRFTDPARIISQVDSFYARWFNRRRHVRVMPDFSTRVEGQLRSSKGALQARLHDVSMGGMSFLVPVDFAEGLDSKSRLDITLSLPGANAPVVCRARVIGVRPYTKNALVGLSFEPGGGIERYASALERYIKSRQEAIALYNQSMASNRRAI